MNTTPWGQKVTPPFRTKKPKADEYNGRADAEHLLERVLLRQRYNSVTLENVTAAIERIVIREVNKRL